MLALGFGALSLSVIAIAIGGGLRDSALAVWAVLAAALLIDLGLSFKRTRTAEITFAPEMFVGETETLTITLPRSASDLTARFDWPEGLDGPKDVTFSALDATTAQALVRVRARRRGQWQISALWLRWPSRLRLLEFVPKVSTDLTVKVVPNIRMVQSGQITSTVLSTLYGVKENRAIGDGSDFHQLRDFVQGMDVKSIDWKRSARHRTLVAKDLRAERNHHVIVALDNGYLMREEIDGLPKIDHAVTAALATAWAAAIGGDMVGLFTFDARPRLFMAPKPGRQAFVRLRSSTAELDYESVETNHTLALTDLNARTPRRSLIIVFSDFVDTTTAELLVENMGVLAKRHVIVFVALRDPHLETLVATSPQDMDGVASLVSAGQLMADRRIVLERLSRLGIVIVDAVPGQVTAKLVSTYLDIKAREVI